jgi:hypothetical protein
MSAVGSILAKVAVFLVTAAVGFVVATVVVSALGNHGPESTAIAAPQYLLNGADTPAGPGVPVAFDEQPDGSAAPLATLSPDDLSAAADALLGDAPGGAQPAAYVKPAGFPRIAPITQFDGGPFEGANCTLASGAMLARLGYGIVTTGSILRTLQDDQDGGTGINDLATALWRGYGITFPHGLIKTDTLKKLLGAGYGAVVQGDYSKVPPALRLQKDFTGGHAIYLDGYYPGNARRGIPEAYYVIDPIGRPRFGYQGDWWPASVVDDFALSWGGGRVVAMWGYPPGGTPPDVVGPDVLPIPPDNNGGGSTPTPAPPSGSPPPSESPAPSASPAGPVLVPVDVGDISVLLPSEPPPVGGGGLGGLILHPIIDVCLFDPPPAGCPTGIEAVFDLGPPSVIQLNPAPNVTVLFVDSDRPDVAMVGFTVDPPATADVKFWKTGVSPATVDTASSMTSVNLFGTTVLLARLDVVAATTYQFQAVAGNGLGAGSSPIGSFTTGDGVTQFDVSLSSVASPPIQLGSGLSPYLHLAPGGYAQPLIPIGALGGATCLEQAGFGGTQLCLDLGPGAPPPATCTRAEVTYQLAGIDASGVVVRAFPTEAGEGSGGVTLDGVLEVDGPAPAGDVNVGCLTSGIAYQIVLDAVGDDRGILATHTVTVP